MSILLENTNAAAVNHAISAERHRMGGTAAGMALTFVIIADELNQSEATRAATFAANQHPCRIVVVIPRPGRGKPQLDAEVWVGDRQGPGETVKLRLKGPLAKQQASVVLPLLLPDTPVVVWWPADAPELPAEDPVGRMANRRITDAAPSRRANAALIARANAYRPGDTDLAWTRVTTWRSVLATALDEPYDPIISGIVTAERNNPSAALLAGWLQAKLRVPVTVKTAKSPGINSVTLKTKQGDIQLTRPSGSLAELTRPRGVARRVPLPRRELRDLVSEELRRLDADEVYAQSLAEVKKGLGPSTTRGPKKSAATGRRSAATETPASTESTGPTDAPTDRTNEVQSTANSTADKPQTKKPGGRRKATDAK